MASTSEMITKLQEFYDLNKQKINDAYLCCSSNPCKVVIEDVDSLKQSILSSIEKIGDWDDSVSELLIKGMQAYVSKFNDINSDLETTWSKAEQLYQKNYSLINDLKKYLDMLSESSDAMVLVKANEVMEDIDNNLNVLKTLGGNTDVGAPPSGQEDPTPTTPTDTYQGVNIMTSSESDALAYLKKNKKHVNLNSIGYTVRYKQASNHPWYTWKSPDGKTYQPNCVMYSLAVGLTSTLSQYYGHQVLVTPSQVMDGLYAYCKNHNLDFKTFIQKNGDYSGDYKELPKALKEIWGVDCVGQKGAISAEDAKKYLSAGNNASIVYRTYNSSGSPGHAATATGLTSGGKFVVSDTYYSREGWVNGTDKFASLPGYNFILTKS